MLVFCGGSAEDIYADCGRESLSRNSVAVSINNCAELHPLTRTLLVTCIPLDAPVRIETHQTRPPWIRPVRKKTPSVARAGPGSSSDSQHGSPEG